MNRWEWIINQSSMEILEFGIDTRSVMDTRNRCLNCNVMSYVQSGGCTAVIDGVRYEQKAGTILFIPAHVMHSHIIEQEQETTFLWWHFNIFVHSIDIMRLLKTRYTVEIADRETFERLFYKYRELKESPMSALSDLMNRKAMEFEIMALLMKNLLEAEDEPCTCINDIPDEFYEMTREIVEYPEKSFSLKEMSQRYHLHATYITNRFKQIFGLTPLQLHNRVVINRIKSELLREGSVSLTELAERFGYNDLPAMTHFFKQHVGCSPSAFRKMNGKEKL